VVGSECPAEQQTEDHQLNADEGGSQLRRQQQEHHCEVAKNAHCEKGDFDRTVLHRPPGEHPTDGGRVQTQSFQHQQRKKQDALPSCKPGAEAAPAIGRFRAQGNRPAFDVRILPQVVGAGVVAAVVVVHQP